MNKTVHMTAEQYRNLLKTGGDVDAAPKESEEQSTLFEIIDRAKLVYPELHMAFHVPNEGKRTAYTGNKLKSEGMRCGVPDIFLDVPKCRYHGLRIELKRKKKYKISPAQMSWIKDLNHYGYAAAVCFGWEEAWELICAYITEKNTLVQWYIERGLGKGEIIDAKKLSAKA